MSIKESIIRSYLQDEEVYEFIWHDITVYIKIILGYVSLIAVLVLLWWWLEATIWSSVYSKYTFSVLLIGLYWKWTVDILDRYLDALLITNMWLLLFTWDWLFKQTVVNMQWVSTETIMYEQQTFRDTLFKKWDIKITVEDNAYSFKDANRPAEKVSYIINRKQKILWRHHYSENEILPEWKDKYELLVEALGEAVSEYVEKKQSRL